MTQFYKSIQSLTSSPEKSDIKSVVIQNALSLTDSLNYTYKQLEKQVDNAQDILMDNTVTINDCLDQINELNKQIRKVTTLGQSPNDLMDSRDVLLDELSSKFGVNLNKKSINGIDVNSDEYNNLKLVNSDSNDFNYNRFSTVKSATIENGKLTVEYYKLGNQNSEAESFTISGNDNTLNQLKSQFEQCRILIADKDGNIDKSLDGATVDSDGGKAVKGIIFQTYAYEPGVNNVSTSNDKIRGEVAGNQSVQATIKSYMEDLDKLAASIAYSINAVQTGTTSDDLSNGVSQDLIFVAKNDVGVKTDSHISASNITVNTDVLNDPTKLNSKPSNESGSGANDRAQSMATLLTTLKFDFGSISNGSTEWNRDGFLSDSKVNFDSSDGTAEKNINLAGKTTGSTLINYYSSLINDSKKNIVNDEEEFRKSLESIKKLMETEIAVPKENKTSHMDNMIMEHNNNVLKERHKGSEKVNDVVDEIKYNNAFSKNIHKSDLSVESVHNEVLELKNLLNKVIEDKSNSVQEIKQGKNIQNSYLDKTEEDKIKNELEKALDELDIDEEFFDDIIKIASEYKDEQLKIKEILRDIFEREILVATKDFKGKVALVGPTGVGKTTTIAKLAGRLALFDKKRVGLITIDTYRIGAIEQLKTYAEIMNIPFKVVITIKEMEEAIESMSDCDVILIDTTGRSSKNAMQISELRAFIEKADPDYVNMVISATTKNRDIKNILNGYSSLEYDNVIITKLDETTVYGSIYNISKRANKPISFITVGQNVPEDIKIPEKEELTRFILGEETLC